jgi:hypothetical protein
MKKPIIAGAALTMLMVACTASRVDPKADISITGSVQRAGGVPVAGSRLAMTRESDAGDVLLGIATIGLACLDRGAAPAFCRSARITSTRSNGGFTYQIKGSDTQSTFGYSAVLSLTTVLGRKANEVSGSSTTYRFHVQTEKLNLPIRLWEPSLAAGTGSFGAKVSFSRVPAGLIPAQLGRGGQRYSVVFARGNEVVWRLGAARSGMTFDLRVLEDSSGAMRVVASSTGLRVSEGLGDEVAFVMRSGARPYESPMDPPVSRGLGCSVVDEHGKRYPIAPCDLTDGTFEKEFRPIICTGATGCVEPRHTAAFIDLGRRISATLVVVRGCQDACRVETSVDARTWRLIGVAQSEQAAFPLTRSVPARYARVSGSPSVDGLTEISVWHGTPRVAEGSLLVSPQRFLPAPTPTPTNNDQAKSGSSSTDDGFNFWVLIAAVLLAGVAGAAVGLFVRRKNPVA